MPNAPIPAGERDSRRWEQLPAYCAELRESCLNRIRPRPKRKTPPGKELRPEMISS